MYVATYFYYSLKKLVSSTSLPPYLMITTKFSSLLAEKKAVYLKNKCNRLTLTWNLRKTARGVWLQVLCGTVSSVNVLKFK
jgi:hypothetical protein